MATALYYTDLVSPEGEVRPSPEVPELLPFTEFYKQVFGKVPSGIKYEALKAANMSSTNLQRLILLPPGSPSEAITALRQAFVSLSKDSDFTADALKTIRFSPTFEVGEQGERLFQQVSQTPADVINFIRQYIEQANR
jgi:hypothetical protein